MNIETIRGWQLSKLEFNIKAYAALLVHFSEADLKTFRDGDDGWTVLQVLGHLRDFEALFYERAQATVEEDNPPLRFPDPDELAEANDYNSQSVADVLRGWEINRQEHLTFLRHCSEDAWERPAQHPTRGNFVLHDQLFLTLWHDSLHLEQLTRILTQAKK